MESSISNVKLTPVCVGTNNDGVMIKALYEKIPDTKSPKKRFRRNLLMSTFD